MRSLLIPLTAALFSFMPAGKSAPATAANTGAIVYADDVHAAPALTTDVFGQDGVKKPSSQAAVATQISPIR